MKQLKDYLYYETDLGQLFLGDCHEIMPLIDKVDLVLTDPPYGIGIHKMNFTTSGAKKFGKATRNDYTDCFKDNKVDLNFLLKYKSIIWGGNYYSDILPSSKSWIIWDKRTHEKFNNDFGDCEMAWTNLGKVPRIFRYLWSGFLKGNNKQKQKRVHPTEKPIELIAFCIKYADIEGIILDPFFGSGTTAVVCEKLNRRWIGIEISEKYCEIAKQRIKNEYNKLKLNLEK